jgi:hypothetical protein
VGAWLLGEHLEGEHPDECPHDHQSAKKGWQITSRSGSPRPVRDFIKKARPGRPAVCTSAALAFYGIVSAIPLTIVVMWIVRHRRSQHLRAVAGLRPCPERRANFQDHYATSGLAGIVLLAL